MSTLPLRSRSPSGEERPGPKLFEIVRGEASAAGPKEMAVAAAAGEATVRQAIVRDEIRRSVRMFPRDEARVERSMLGGKAGIWSAVLSPCTAAKFDAD
jgi:hypothetical protein